MAKSVSDLLKGLRSVLDKTEVDDQVKSFVQNNLMRPVDQKVIKPIQSGLQQVELARIQTQRDMPNIIDRAAQFTPFTATRFGGQELPKPLQRTGVPITKMVTSAAKTVAKNVNDSFAPLAFKVKTLPFAANEAQQAADRYLEQTQNIANAQKNGTITPESYRESMNVAQGHRQKVQSIQELTQKLKDEAVKKGLFGGVKTALTGLGLATGPTNVAISSTLSGGLNAALTDGDRAEAFGEGAAKGLEYAGVNKITAPVIDPIVEAVGRGRPLIQRLVARGLTQGAANVAEDNLTNLGTEGRLSSADENLISFIVGSVTSPLNKYDPNNSLLEITDDGAVKGLNKTFIRNKLGQFAKQYSLNDAFVDEKAIQVEEWMNKPILYKNAVTGETFTIPRWKGILQDPDFGLSTKQVDSKTGARLTPLSAKEAGGVSQEDINLRKLGQQLDKERLDVTKQQIEGAVDNKLDTEPMTKFIKLVDNKIKLKPTEPPIIKVTQTPQEVVDAQGNLIRFKNNQTIQETIDANREYFNKPVSRVEQETGLDPLAMKQLRKNKIVLPQEEPAPQSIKEEIELYRQRLNNAQPTETVEQKGRIEPQSVQSTTPETTQINPNQVSSTIKDGSTTTPVNREQLTQNVVQNGSKNLQPSEGNIPLKDEDLISKLTQALKEAKPLRSAQERLYDKARKIKFARMMGARKRVGGEKGFYTELGALKGELPKVDYESIRQQFDQPSVDRLFDIVRQHKGLDDWEKLTAEGGLAKILGQEGGSVPTKGEIEKLYAAFGKDFTEALLSKRSTFEKLGEAGLNLYNLPRSLMAGVGDLSGTLMQNLLFAYRHPILTSKNFVKEVKMFASNEFFKASQEEITSRPTYNLMKKAKLHLTDVGPLIQMREEAFMSNLAEKIPGVGKVIKASGRAYTGFLNRMRADVFDQMITSFKNSGGDIEDPAFLKSLGEFVNAGTGRGDLGVLEKSAPVLSQTLFSARKLAATAQMINPAFYIKAHPAVRKEALLTMMSFLGGGMAITSLADLIPGVEVGKDPTNADYGKIKIGNTRFNVWGSYQQIAVLMARLWKGYGTSSVTGKKFTLNEGYKPVTRLDLISRFFENKEHPTLSLILSALRGQNQVGEAFDATKEVLGRFIPMVLADGYDLYQEHGPVGMLGLIPSILGIPSQTYGRQIPTMERTPAGNASIKLKPVPGLEDAIINKITGKEVSNIPQAQWQGIIDNKKRETDIGIAKEELKTKGGSQVVGSSYLYVNEKGEAKEINLDRITSLPQPPAKTGNTSLDKEATSRYKSELNSIKNDIYDLLQQKQITEEQAAALFDQVDSQYRKAGGSKKIKIKSVDVPEAKVTTPSGRISLVKFGSNSPRLKLTSSPRKPSGKIKLKKLSKPTVKIAKSYYKGEL